MAALLFAGLAAVTSLPGARDNSPAAAAPPVPATEARTPRATSRPLPTMAPAVIVSRASRTTPTPFPTRIARDRPPNLVDVVDYGFDPPVTRVMVGTLVSWKNVGQVGHVVASDQGDQWTSGALGVAGTYSRRFVDPGTYSYHCVPHPNMRGIIVVE